MRILFLFSILTISSLEPPLLLCSGWGNGRLVIPVAVQKDRGLWERDWCPRRFPLASLASDTSLKRIEREGLGKRNNNNISFICMTIIMWLQNCKSFNLILQFMTMIMQCNDYYSQSSVISMI